MFRNTVLTLVSSFYLFIIVSILALVALIGYQKAAYSELQEAEKKAEPKFIALNEKVFSQIPAHKGVKKDSYENRFDRGSHSVRLIASYRITDNTLLDVYNFYDQNLTTRGWTRVRNWQHKDEAPFYYQRIEAWYQRETACFSLKVWENETAKGLNIDLFHDPRKQPFSPSYPPDWIWQIPEYGETYISQCPLDE